MRTPKIEWFVASLLLWLKNHCWRCGFKKESRRSLCLVCQIDLKNPPNDDAGYEE